MSSAVEAAISCSKVDVPAAPEPEEAAASKAKNAAAEHGGDAANGKCGEATPPPHCHEDEEDEEEAPKVIDLGPRVSIKDQLEKDKVLATRPPARRHCRRDNVPVDLFHADDLAVLSFR
jgi:Rho GDP-dissociation inhibitor